jgi:hypothetical protein
MDRFDPRRFRRRFALRWLLPVPIGIVLGAFFAEFVVRLSVSAQDLCAFWGGVIGLIFGFWIRFRRTGPTTRRMGKQTQYKAPRPTHDQPADGYLSEEK